MKNVLLAIVAILFTSQAVLADVHVCRHQRQRRCMTVRDIPILDSTDAVLFDDLRFHAPGDPAGISYFGPSFEDNWPLAGVAGTTLPSISIYRGIITFDTSVLGSSASISKVEFFRHWPAGGPGGFGVTNVEIDYYLSKVVPYPYVYDQSLYDSGTFVFSESGAPASFTNGQILDFGAAAIDLINKAGKTTLKFKIAANDLYLSDQISPNNRAQVLLDNWSTPCFLRVTYTVPKKYIGFGKTGGVSHGKILAQ